MPKSKEQKRREAVERLERGPRYVPSSPRYDGELLLAKRHAEAKRLREKFNIQ